MSDPWLPPSNEPSTGEPPPLSPPPPGYWPPVTGGPPPPGYGWPQAGYGAPPGGYGGYPGYGAPGFYGGGGYGPPGRVRPTGTSIALFILTVGIYGYVYNYQVHSEMKLHSGRGIGGGIALLLTFLANVAMPFVTPAEVGSLYARRGEREPVNGWTGLWVLVPAVAGYILLFVAVIAVTSVTASDGSSSGRGLGVGIAVAFVLFGACVIGGGVYWFVQTNGALNRYWQSLGVPA
jgi:Domain of unknown function (DUF4234)